ncbi:unnamed protein product, partial [Candidula unifasciata]
LMAKYWVVTGEIWITGSLASRAGKTVKSVYNHREGPACRHEDPKCCHSCG